MVKKLIVWVLFTGCTTLSCYAQFNDYKYIIVPKRFDIFKKANQYQTSTLVKYLLTNHGFQVIYDDAIPEALFKDRCLGLTAQLVDNSSLLQTKIAVVFLDCRNKEVYLTQTGSSKIKTYKEGYAECIQKALQELDAMAYQYKERKQDPPSVPEVPPTITSPVSEPDPLPETAPAQTAEKTQIKKSDTAHIERATEPKWEPEVAQRWTEAVNENGFLLLAPDRSESWTLMRTSNPEVYLGYSQNKQGIAFRKSNGWKLEYYLGDERQEVQLQTRDQ